jgi:hypothetical protein
MPQFYRIRRTRHSSAARFWQLRSHQPPFWCLCSVTNPCISTYPIQSIPYGTHAGLAPGLGFNPVADRLVELAKANHGRLVPS